MAEDTMEVFEFPYTSNVKRLLVASNSFDDAKTYIDKMGLERMVNHHQSEPLSVDQYVDVVDMSTLAYAQRELAYGLIKASILNYQAVWNDIQDHYNGKSLDDFIKRFG